MGISGCPLCFSTHLTPDGLRRFTIPVTTIPVNVLRRDHQEWDGEARIDTIVLMPDDGKVIVTWRYSVANPRGMIALHEVILGHRPPSFFRARRQGKAWYPNAAALIEAKSRPVGDEA